MSDRRLDFRGQAGMFVFNFKRKQVHLEPDTARSLTGDEPATPAHSGRGPSRGVTTQRKQWYFPDVRARLTKDFIFEAAQTLPNAPEGHKCRSVHGHSFKVEVSVEGDVDPKTGWVYDHARISDAMKPLMKLPRLRLSERY